MKQTIRPRRLRQNSQIRSLVVENSLSPSDFIMPLFLIDGKNTRVDISSMPGQCRFSLDLLIEECKQLQNIGIKCVALFPALDNSLKTPTAKEALNIDGLYYRAISEIKSACPNLLLMTDIALDPYSSDGHDGLVDSKTGEILNDQTLEILSQMAILQARSGADILGPSDMMDGRVGVIRDALEQENFKNTLIMSYTAKYASSFYGPFRDALDSAPKSGDKLTYQMSPSNSTEALIEAQLDQQEGADILMVKPGLPYLDIIKLLKDNFNLPIAAYNVSGEYAMIKAAAQNGWLDEKRVMLEMLTSFKRAGADIILTYFAKDAAGLIANQ
ncbi:MAG: porphobilinogen synthase [Halobacteriovoraceae bacterium]|nr:porphobilinogen synthase [Halobacteriovoraceae bacterium]